LLAKFILEKENLETMTQSKAGKWTHLKHDTKNYPEKKKKKEKQRKEKVDTKKFNKRETKAGKN